MGNLPFAAAYRSSSDSSDRTCHQTAQTLPSWASFAAVVPELGVPRAEPVAVLYPRLLMPVWADRDSSSQMDL